MRPVLATIGAACALSVAVLAGLRVPGFRAVGESLSGGGVISTGGDAVPASSVASLPPAEMPPAEQDARSALDAGSVRGSFRVLRSAPEPPTSAAAFLVADPSSGAVFAARRADDRWPVASITKLITAAVATREIAATSTVAVGDDDTARVADAGAGTFPAGSVYESRDLVRAMLTVSSNEAAEALASLGDRAAFIARMNALAAGWGMADTYFADPTGLSVANQSTPRDLLRLATHLSVEHADLFRMTRAPTAIVTDQVARKRLVLRNINQFAGQAGFVGGKTGFIEASEGNLLSVFSHEGSPVVIVVLGSADRFADTKALIDWFRAHYTALP